MLRNWSSWRRAGRRLSSFRRDLRDAELVGVYDRRLVVPNDVRAAFIIGTIAKLAGL